MVDFITNLIPTLEHLGRIMYTLCFLAAFLESLAFVGAFIPGSLFIALGGFLASGGYIDVGDLIWFAAIGAIAGDVVSYYLGTKGTKFFRAENKLLKLSHLERGKRFFKKHGNKSVFIGRFVAFMRPLVPFVAGLSQMRVSTFLFWNILSGILWSVAYVLLGYFFGGALKTIEVWSTRAVLFIVVLLLLLALIWLIMTRSGSVFRSLRSFYRSIRRSIVRNPRVALFVEQHPSFVRFLQHRFRRGNFFGLPLTLLVLAFAYVFFLLIGVIEDVATSDVIVLTDARVADLFSVFRDPALVSIFTWITAFGEWQVIVSGAVVTTAALILIRRRTYVIPLWVALVGSESFDLLGKLVLHRPRPDVALYMEKSFSFPSGHATVAVAFYGFLTYVLFRLIGKWKWRINILFAGIVVVLALGLSRLYLGVHYLSDVWGGYLLGALWLLIGIAIAEWQRSRRRVSAPRPARRAKTAAIILAAVELAFALNFAFTYHPPLAHAVPTKETVQVSDILQVLNEHRLPAYTETLFGRPGEPISFIVVAKDDEALIRAITRAGWYQAEPITTASVIELTRSVFFGEDYLSAPMTPEFWDGSVNDLNFEKPIETKSVRSRHHVRFWRTEFTTPGGSRVYVGTANQGAGIRWLISHAIRPDIDAERELLFSDLKSVGVVHGVTRIALTAPVRNSADDTGFFTDGNAYLITL